MKITDFHSKDGHPAAFCRDYGPVYYENPGIMVEFTVRIKGAAAAAPFDMYRAYNIVRGVEYSFTEGFAVPA